LKGQVVRLCQKRRKIDGYVHYWYEFKRNGRTNDWVFWDGAHIELYWQKDLTHCECCILPGRFNLPSTAARRPNTPALHPWTYNRGNERPRLNLLSGWVEHPDLVAHLQSLDHELDFAQGCRQLASLK